MDICVMSRTGQVESGGVFTVVKRQARGNNKERGTKSDLRPSAVKIITRKRREKEQRKLRSNTSVQFLCHF